MSPPSFMLCTQLGSVNHISMQRPWDADEWTNSDDRVRGGASESHLEVAKDREMAVFHGTLDTKTLGGAGFASQRTKDNAAGSPWDLSSFDALRVRLRHESKGQCDGKKYVLALKDEIVPKRPDGRESSSISWEAEFSCPAAILSTGEEASPRATQDVVIPWRAFKPTYRGKPKEDSDPLRLESVKRMSIMMRSFFDEQSGDFKLTIDSIAAMHINNRSATGGVQPADSDQDAQGDDGSVADSTSQQKDNPGENEKKSWFKRLFCAK
ncbi:CIA30 family protein [Zalerion maritima]|uniref:CIA30 family protein n=1 Tax=Zalerion maritima TaxID=339359 RepID=A0AAD5WMJ2_9PEZI|nr:CIA30 family protein [Zalerion maritima]